MMRSFLTTLAAAVALAAVVTEACLGPAGNPCACTGIPSNNNYYLTDFNGQSCACGPCYKYGEWFAADKQRFGCGATLSVCKGWGEEKPRDTVQCVKVTVVDYGPSCFVENDAGGPVLDASPAVCRAITGGGSCGWSDHFQIHVTRTAAPEEDGIPLGPYNMSWADFKKIHLN